MAAATAGQAGVRVLLLDHANAPGKKILISGGGRCNFTNIDTRAECYLSQNPHFAKSALSRYTAMDFIDLVDHYGISWHEKTLGQLFCDQSAKQIVSLLLDECTKGNVTIALNASIDEIDHSDGHFKIASRNQRYHAPQLIVATGGPSIPKMGASGFAYDVARQFKLKIVEPRPALVPLTLSGDEVLFRELSGVSAHVIASHGETHFEEAALFTHKGLSGPAILQISSYWKPGNRISIDFLPHETKNYLVGMKKHSPALSLGKVLSTVLPERLARTLCYKVLEDDQADKFRLGDVKDTTLQRATEKLHDWEFNPNGTEGFAKAEVTIGGVSTAELSSKTMESKKVQGLYFIGEAVDVTGWLGGYNFQWAWASGVAAGQAVAERNKQ